MKLFVMGILVAKSKESRMYCPLCLAATRESLSAPAIIHWTLSDQPAPGASHKFKHYFYGGSLRVIDSGHYVGMVSGACVAPNNNAERPGVNQHRCIKNLEIHWHSNEILHADRVIYIGSYSPLGTVPSKARSK